MTFLRNLDLITLVLALPVFLGAKLPILGYAAGASLWLMWRGIGFYSERKADAATTPKAVAGITLGSMIARFWILGLSLIGLGFTLGDQVGLAAAVLTLTLFTLAFASKMTERYFDQLPSAEVPR